MELGTLFTEQKWNILRCLSQEQLSPMQLSERLDSTMANISQQLKLLEAAKLVKKQKIKNRDKGKPRSLFSLTDDYVFLTSAMNQFAGKKLLKATRHHKVMLKIWFLENQDTQYQLQKLYWNLEPDLDQIDSILVNETTDAITIVSQNKALSNKVKQLGANIKVVSKQSTDSETDLIIYQQKSHTAG